MFSSCRCRSSSAVPRTAAESAMARPRRGVLDPEARAGARGRVTCCRPQSTLELDESAEIFSPQKNSTNLRRTFSPKKTRRIRGGFFLPKKNLDESAEDFFSQKKISPPPRPISTTLSFLSSNPDFQISVAHPAGPIFWNRRIREGLFLKKTRRFRRGLFLKKNSTPPRAISTTLSFLSPGFQISVAHPAGPVFCAAEKNTCLQETQEQATAFDA